MDNFELKRDKLREDIQARKIIVHELQLDEASAPIKRKQLSGGYEQTKARILELRVVIAQRQEETQKMRGESVSASSQLAVDAEMIRNHSEMLEKKNRMLLENIAKHEKLWAIETSRISDMKNALQDVREQQAGLRIKLGATLEEREEFVRQRAELNQRVRHAQSVHESNLSIFANKESELETLVAKRREQDKHIREVRDKEYMILEKIRQTQVDLKKTESENSHIARKAESASKLRDSASARLKELKSKIDEALAETTNLKNEKLKLEQATFESAEALQSLRLLSTKRNNELRRVEDELAPAVVIQAQLRNQLESSQFDRNQADVDLQILRRKLEAESTNYQQTEFELRDQELTQAELLNQVESLRGELSRVTRTRESSGVSQPYLIKPADQNVNLLDRLQINQFLKYAQSMLQPIPPIVEKISEILGLLQSTQDKSDMALVELARSNAIVAALRRVALELSEKSENLDAFKSRSMRTYITNAIEEDASSRISLNIESLSVAKGELEVIFETITRLDAAERISEIRLNDNLISDTALPVLMRIIFDFPYLAHLQVARNQLSQQGVTMLINQLKTMDGITAVTVTLGKEPVQLGRISNPPIGALIEARSGKLLRVVLDATQQSEKQALEPPVPKAPVIDSEIDRYLSSPAGIQETPPRPKPVKTVTQIKEVPQDQKPASNVPKYREHSPPVRKSVSRISATTDSSFDRQLSVSKRAIADKAMRLGIKTLPPPRKALN